METRTPVIMQMVEWKCPHCKEGNMRFVSDSAVLTTYPPIYLHRCTKCEYESHNRTLYPYIEYTTDSGETFRGSVA